MNAIIIIVMKKTNDKVGIIKSQPNTNAPTFPLKRFRDYKNYENVDSYIKNTYSPKKSIPNTRQWFYGSHFYAVDKEGAQELSQALEKGINIKEKKREKILTPLDVALSIISRPLKNRTTEKSGKTWIDETGKRGDGIEHSKIFDHVPFGSLMINAVIQDFYVDNDEIKCKDKCESNDFNCIRECIDKNLPKEKL